MLDDAGAMYMRMKKEDTAVELLNRWEKQSERPIDLQ